MRAVERWLGVAEMAIAVMKVLVARTSVHESTKKMLTVRRAWVMV